MNENGKVLVKCKYNHNFNSNPDKDVCYKNMFTCTGIPCEDGYVTWTFFLINKEHLIEVKK